jgi:hypothetical protein
VRCAFAVRREGASRSVRRENAVAIKPQSAENYKPQTRLYKLERICFNEPMERENVATVPTHCPVCQGDLLVTHLVCASCGTDVTGTFALGNLAGLREPHASLIDLFLRKRGNVKEVERELGLSYPTIRARLDEAFEAAGYPRETSRSDEPDAMDANFGADLGERIRRRVEESLASVRGSARRSTVQRSDAEETAAERSEILGRLERKEISAGEAAALLRQMRERR